MKYTSQKISDSEYFYQKTHVYYANLKQNIWTEFFPVSVLSGPKESQILFEILSESKFLKIFKKIYDQLFGKKHIDVITLTCKLLI